MSVPFAHSVHLKEMFLVETSKLQLCFVISCLVTENCVDFPVNGTAEREICVG
jgi:hypothetical protein